MHCLFVFSLRSNVLFLRDMVSWHDKEQVYKRWYSGETVSGWISMLGRDTRMGVLDWRQEGTMPSCPARLRKMPSIKRRKVSLWLGKYKSIEFSSIKNLLKCCLFFFSGNCSSFWQILWVYIMVRFSVYSVSAALIWVVLFWLDNIELPYWLPLHYTVYFACPDWHDLLSPVTPSGHTVMFVLTFTLPRKWNTQGVFHSSGKRWNVSCDGGITTMSFLFLFYN